MRSGDKGIESHFSRSSHTSDFKTDYPAAVLPGVWCKGSVLLSHGQGVSAITTWPGGQCYYHMARGSVLLPHGSGVSAITT